MKLPNQDNEFDRIMDMVKDMAQPAVEQTEKNNKMLEGVYAMLIICIPLLTVSTILWQWLG
jgi:hypothetical protein